MVNVNSGNNHTLSKTRAEMANQTASLSARTQLFAEVLHQESDELMLFLTSQLDSVNSTAAKSLQSAQVMA